MLEGSKTRPIDQAAELGNIPITELLFSHGASLEAEIKDGDKAPLWSLFAGQEAAAEFLIRKGANVKACDIDGLSPIHIAAVRNFTEVAKLVWKVPPNVAHDKTEAGWMALHNAAAKGHVEILTMLLENGASIDAISGTSVIALMAAVDVSQHKCVDLLCKRGAQVMLCHPLAVLPYTSSYGKIRS
jgi:ankyrin repeat protein